MISPCSLVGNSSKPLSGLVLHFGEAGTSSLPCEAAWVSRPNEKQYDCKPPKVKVYVSPASLETMKHAYCTIGDHVSVVPLRFTESELDAQAFISMMAVGNTDSAPLYMQIVFVRTDIITIRNHYDLYSPRVS
jgi:hypothetical protein